MIPVHRVRRFLSALLVFEETLWQLQDSERQVDKLEAEKAELTGRYTVAQAHIQWQALQLAAKEAECERLRQEVFSRPRLPTDAELEHGSWR